MWWQDEEKYGHVPSSRARLAPPHHHVKPHRVVRHFTPGTPAHFHADDHCHVSGTECGLHRGPESFCRFCTDPGFSPLACPSPVLDTQCSSHSFWSSLVRRSSITRSYRASKAATTSLTTASSLHSASRHALFGGPAALDPHHSQDHRSIASVNRRLCASCRLSFDCALGPLPLVQ